MDACTRFQHIREYVDAMNICDYIESWLDDTTLDELCDSLEEEFSIKYEYDDGYQNDQY